MDSPEQPKSARERLQGFWVRWRYAAIGAAIFLVVGLAGSTILDARMEGRRKVELISFTSLLQTRLRRELDNALFLTGGLKSYLVVRRGVLVRSEVDAILRQLYQDSRHVRNFGVAVGYRLLYVYPIKGNEKVLGLDYRKVPSQLAAVQRVIDGGAPLLLGPMRLVQGGQGLIYRVPVSVQGKYWGLISTVIDSESLLADAFALARAEKVDLAIRGRDARGMDGEVFRGDAKLFGQNGVELADVQVPGGKWVMAVRGGPGSFSDVNAWRLRVLAWVLALFLAWGVYALLQQRARLARMAMFDALTGLPNRTLIEDRLERAIASQRRNPATVSALLFADLDDFKRINDEQGHRAGDAVLQGVAERATRAVRGIDSVGRWGGDEMIVILEDAGRDRIPELVERVRRAIETPIDYAGLKLQVGVSIGVAIVPDDGDGVQELIRRADRRMYEEKQKRRGAARSKEPAEVAGDRQRR
ncbi:MAG TPA: diguanylate cyclase [Burkholderiales bacterium]|nr:diguanylate cyclase [Burkholderiales bacterium]